MDWLLGLLAKLPLVAVRWLLGLLAKIAALKCENAILRAQNSSEPTSGLSEDAVRALEQAGSSSGWR
jgi:hypothetical protein